MTYAGNPAVSPEVRQRILGTFRQTLELAATGSRQEASLGCDFILQLDPAFAPARALLERLRAAQGPVAVDDLRDEAAAGEAGERPAAEDEPAVEDRLFELPELPDLPRGAGDVDLGSDEPRPDEPGIDELAGVDLVADDLIAGAFPSEPAEQDDPARRAELRRDVQRLYGERRDEALLSLAEGRREEIADDRELARLVAAAASRQEAAPYVESFLDAAREARAQGRTEEAAAALGKARSLDPDHPEVRRLGDGAAPAAAAAGSRAREPAPGAAGEGDGRIEELLAEGQAAFDRGDHQGAIDAWSRIFLIDIDHEEASRRIDEARRLKSETERQVEEVFHDAQRAEEEGDARAARVGYTRVLELAPGHLAARERRDQLAGGWEEEPDEGLVRPPDRRTAPPWEAAEPAGAGGSELAGGAAAAGPLREEILVPPEPGAEAAATEAPVRPSLVAVRESKAGRRFALIGSLVLVLVAVAGWLVYSNREAIFPNSDEPPAAAAAEDPIARATRLHQAGRTAIAVNQLRRLPPTAPQYEEAQALISQWEAAAQSPSGDEAEAGPSARDAEERAELIAAARAAAERGEELAAAELLQRADEIVPLEGEEAELAAAVDRELAPIAGLVDLYRSGDYEMALPELWRAHQAAGDDPDLRRMIVDSYYNIAVRELQRGNPKVAADRLEDALELAPDDPDVRRTLRFARTYAQRERDMLYRIYVKYLPPR